MIRVAVLYTVVSQGRISDDLASRFVSTYHQFPVGAEHDLFIICNGGPLSLERALLFCGVASKFFPRVNTPGWDIDGYMDAARGPCKDFDMLVALGESCYFHRAGWLARLVEAWQKHGPGFYGPFSSNNVRGHLHTTAFCCSPAMLLSYPVKIVDRNGRMEFEHGQGALWRRLAARGLPVRLVTFDGEYEPRLWRTPKNILWKGDQSALLLHSNHTDRFRDGSANRKRSWQAQADSPFK